MSTRIDGPATPGDQSPHETDDQKAFAEALAQTAQPSETASPSQTQNHLADKTESDDEAGPGPNGKGRGNAFGHDKDDEGLSSESMLTMTLTMMEKALDNIDTPLEHLASERAASHGILSGNDGQSLLFGTDGRTDTAAVLRASYVLLDLIDNIDPSEMDGNTERLILGQWSGSHAVGELSGGSQDTPSEAPGSADPAARGLNR